MSSYLPHKIIPSMELFFAPSNLLETSSFMFPFGGNARFQAPYLSLQLLVM
ncbi:hypothetical protein VM1G_11434 [Cytospora mali]|uniref:Uncharacterized protein n=1 Tax=Cytospora mali TaxID=578113 RepID=A0A194VPI0_CYTMA|nr:hypothetical protein VM1G_11434 [Valsa mali]